MLERDEEIGALRGLLRQVGGGAGAVALVEGEPGIGKTALLAELRTRAQRAGMTVLPARAGELETKYPFGIVRQLYDPFLARCAPHERARILAGAAALSERAVGGAATEPDATSDVYAVLHGLYWLTANAGAVAPLVLCVDDLQWVDEPSLRFLEFLAHRLEGLPVLIAAAVRTQRSGPQLDALFAQARVLRPATFSEAAVAQGVAEGLGTDVDPAFATACHGATGGNPFLLEQLVAELQSEGVEPTAASAARVQRLGPAGISRATLARLGRLPPEALALARAAAVLGGPVSVSIAAALAEIDESLASRLADALADAYIFARERPLDFVHPIVRTSVYAELPLHDRSVAHRSAARLLAARGADPDAVAGHLMAVDPTADPWVAERLSTASERAVERGAPDAAANYLLRALEEPPPDAVRPELLLALGTAELYSGAPGAAEHLRQAIASAGDPVLRARAAWQLAGVLTLAAEDEQGAVLLAGAIDELPEAERELGLRLEAELWTAGYTSARSRRFVTARQRRFAPREPPASAADRLFHGIAALELALTTGPAGDAVAAALEALGDGALLAAVSADATAFYGAACTLFYADAGDAAERVFTAAGAEALARGSVRGAAIAHGWRGLARMRRGRLADAAADGRQLLDAAEHVGPIAILVGTVPVLVNHLERGELEAAEALLAAYGIDRSLPESIISALLLEPRARLRAARRETEAALADLEACGRLEAIWDVESPGLTSWRAHAALLGDKPELAAVEVARARRYGSPRALGVALRAAGLVGRDLGLLREAVLTLDRAGAELEHARALVDLGAELRRGDQRVEARMPLRAGLAAARTSGALALAARAHDELAASGVRLRKLLTTGVDALTPSERRVAQMAAEGLRNRDIAQTLFVTVKTVEGHLTAAYLKLGVESREALGAKLAS